MSKPWAGRAASYALRRVKVVGRARSLPCVICEGAIDYALEYPDPMSCSVQHVVSRSVGPELTWVPSNWSPAHLFCNQSAGDGLSSPFDLGVTSG